MQKMQQQSIETSKEEIDTFLNFFYVSIFMTKFIKFLLRILKWQLLIGFYSING
jgi:hypothetical protein